MPLIVPELPSPVYHIPFDNYHFAYYLHRLLCSSMQRIHSHFQRAMLKLNMARSAHSRTQMHLYMTFAQNASPGRPTSLYIQNLRFPSWSRDASTVGKDTAATLESPCSTTSVLPPSNNGERLLLREDIEALSVIDHRDTHKLYCTKSPSEANSIIRKMVKEDQVFGLDLEWRPTFVKGSKENKTALIQLCNAKSILLIQISRMAVFPQELKGLLQSRKILKAGVNIRGDALKLYRDFRILTNGLVELGTLARATNTKELEGYKGLSLRLLCAIFLGKSLPKGPTRISRWDAPTLSSKQRQYAADDAYASYALYEAIDGLRKQNSISKIKISHLADDKPSATTNSKPIEVKKSVVATKVTITTVVATKGDTTQDIQTDIQNIADDMFHTNTIEQSTIIEQTDTSMPFTTTEVLKKKEP